MLAIKVLIRLGRRLRWALLILVTWVATATTGYRVIEEWSWFDSFYMTIITIFTIGYQEVHPLTMAGRIWSIVVIGAGFLIVASVAAELASGPLARLWGENKLERELSDLHDHYIICGLGRVGWQVALTLHQQGAVFGVVDPENRHAEDLQIWNVPHLAGDATEDAVLQRMRIDRARGLVAAASTDAINIYVTLTARGLNSDLVIAARAEEPSAERKLYRAGANFVLAPTAVGGRKLATLLTRPVVAEYIDSVLYGDDLPFFTEQVELAPTSPLCTLTIAELQARIAPEHQGPAVIALKPAGEGLFAPHPPGTRKLVAGDVLVVAGTEEEIAPLRDLSH